MADHKRYDVVIVGGGPIGLSCAIEAKRAGLSYVVLEKGCLVNSLYNYPLDMTFFSTADRLEIGDLPFVTTRPKPKRADALEYYRKVAEYYALEIRFFERVNSICKDGDTFVVQTGKAGYHSENVVIATGFYDIPKRLNVPGEDLPHVFHYYKDPHYFTGQRLVVVGASNSAVDAALETYRKGARVTMVVRGPGIGERVKYWVKPDIENRIRYQEIQAYFSSQVTRISSDAVEISTPQGIKQVGADFVLALTGYQPDFNFLERAGITLSDDGIFHPSYDRETMESNVQGLYLAGVVCGGLKTHEWFIENSRVHARLIVNNIIK